MTELSKPRIVCAALKHFATEMLVVGPRHFDKTMHEQINRLPKFLDVRTSQWHQGFIDQHGVFYDRQTAWKIAFENGQILRKVSNDGIVLYSENLY